MDTHGLLHVAREIIGKVPSCMAITVDRNGEANARVVNPKPLSDAWTVRFATDRRSRKSEEIERSGSRHFAMGGLLAQHRHRSNRQSRQPATPRITPSRKAS